MRRAFVQHSVRPSLAIIAMMAAASRKSPCSPPLVYPEEQRNDQAGGAVDVVFVYGDHGPGGLTVDEATHLARSIIASTDGAVPT